jgi:membrane associated rhomboid family serine protease
MDKDLRIILYSFIPPTFFVLILWLVKYMEYSSGYGFSEFGVYPRHVEGLKGIITSPFIHGDLEHLASNSVPLLLLGAGLVYFYKKLAIRVFGIIWFLSGFGLWLGGREVIHIGASGIIYGLAFFLFVSGILRKDTRLMAISLLVVFLYGSMIWGVFPLWRGISWEAHLFGSLAGILCAFVYRHEGPQRQQYVWETEPEEEAGPSEENKLPEEISSPEKNEYKINYIYKAKDQQEDDEKN